MSKIKEKIIGINFLKFFRLFLPLAIIVVLLGGIVTCIIMKAQISEAVNYVHGEKYISEGIYRLRLAFSLLMPYIKRKDNISLIISTSAAKFR